MIARLTQAKISPKKMNLVAGMIRGKKVNEALDILKFTPKKAAQILYKLLASAKSNAEHNFKQDGAKLVIEQILVGDSITLKRHQPVSRGRAHPILKRSSNVIIKVNVTN